MESSIGCLLLVLFIVVFALLVSKSQKAKEKQQEEGSAKLTEKLTNEKFNIDKKVENDDYKLLIDDKSKRLCFVDYDNCRIVAYKDVIKFDVIEDKDSVTKGRAGSAVVGGLLFGGLGAIAGASRSKKRKTTCYNLGLKIYVNDLNNPVMELVFISREVQRNSIKFKNAYEEMERFEAILSYVVN